MRERGENGGVYAKGGNSPGNPVSHGKNIGKIAAKTEERDEVN